ncbi:SHOCT domain-containing protein [Thiohalomonas denitrificans]|uniref:Putative membrane protein n=1 Tax=Thiohalomonas denitrificans TaxID=415747 RepID=A0A1G5QB49_9GAMM|nr:SHOCT domain-containing protein [Thiohalomonas denitrificans]SCZ59054.1 putative membrane protein [Thiohalomonas denitrificans]
MWWDNMHGYGGGFWPGWLLMVLFWILVILGIVAVIKFLLAGTSRNAAIDILKERYARGEISKDDFEKMRRELE